MNVLLSTQPSRTILFWCIYTGYAFLLPEVSTLELWRCVLVWAVTQTMWSQSSCTGPAGVQGLCIRYLPDKRALHWHCINRQELVGILDDSVVDIFRVIGEWGGWEPLNNGINRCSIRRVNIADYQGDQYLLHYNQGGGCSYQRRS